VAYLTAGEFLLRYDQNRVADYVTLDPNSPVEPANLTSDAVLLALLEDGKDLILAAARVGGRYTDAQLDGLSDNFIKRLNAALTYGLIVERKGYTGAELKVLAPGYDTALGWLAQLEAGSLIFNIQAAADAGVTQTQQVVPAVNPVSVVYTTRLLPRFFGSTGQANGGCGGCH
jgi:hypothetical protein